MAGEMTDFGNYASKEEHQRLEEKFDTNMNAMQLNIQVLVGSITALTTNVQRMAPNQQRPALVLEDANDEEDVEYSDTQAIAHEERLLQ
ncbi:hypothetical protein GUJ93_ZPchr0009g580 [Zizania palustris]|uniref:Uncharacterized protein n=1 Tax=Zizania palustris TaxID=103762 RepID=A0A8J5S2N4_ZIZPA|nr:hypothetical protein GUJ93_ZPchr0009g580 [Zizania palustris]